MEESSEESVVYAPYNFVPLSGYVHPVEWADKISIDAPFSDGISGHLEVELEVVTPLCVGDQRGDGLVEPFKTLDDELAIPGTSIKGMLRNVVEIATFSKFQFVDRDRRFAVRDLYNRELYGKHMTDTVGSSPPVFAPSPRTGWLENSGEGWTVQPCKMSRVEQGDLLDVLGGDAGQKLKGCFTKKSTSQQKYEAWISGGKSLELAFTPGEITDHSMSRGSGKLRFSLAESLGKSGGEVGRLVFTGQPGPNRRLGPSPRPVGKHREFIFYDDSGVRIPVPRSVRRNFELNHSAQQSMRHQGTNEPNDEWGYWKKKLQAGGRVPVFFKGDGREVVSLGLALMYRLAYNHSVGDSIDNVSIDHHPDPGSKQRRLRPVVDFADALFGYVRSHESGGEGARGRVDVGLFKLTSGESLTAVHTAILNGPKPTYYPSYIDQSSQGLDSASRLGVGKEYVTFMDSFVEPRGWKRYPARPSVEMGSPAGQEATDVSTSWRAVQEGIFRGKLRFHNVREVELGAILWALDFGGMEGSCHTLGYAKPFGFGNVRLKVAGSALRFQTDGSEIDLARACQAFTDYMGSAVSDWEGTEQIVQLLAMACPEAAAEHTLEYMALKDQGGRNEFVEAKKKRGFLPPYADFTGLRDRERFPREGRGKAWEERTGEAQKAEDQEKAAKEAERRKNLGSLGRLQETWPEVLELAPVEQLEWLRQRRQILAEEKEDPRAYKAALATFVPEAVEEATRLGASRAASARMDEVKAQLAQHAERKPKDAGGKAIKKGKDFKRWKSQRVQLENRLAEAGRGREREEEQRQQYLELLSWLAGSDD